MKALREFLLYSAFYLVMSIALMFVGTGFRWDFLKSAPEELGGAWILLSSLYWGKQIWDRFGQEKAP